MSRLFKGIILSLDSLKELLIFIVSKDTSIYDEKIAKKIFSDGDNIKKLKEKLDKKDEEPIEIKFDENQKLEIVD